MLDELQRILSFSDAPLYNIKAVVQKTSIQTSTLRAWERRYGIPNPGRSAHGHRLYSPRDLAIITWLRQRVEEGMSIGHAVSLLQQTFDESQSKPTDHQATTLGDMDTHIDMRRLQQALVQALLRFDLRQAHAVVNSAVAISPIEGVVLHLFQPTVSQIDLRWADGLGSVVEEHFVSNFLRQRLMGMFQIFAPLALGPRAVCACPSEEHHELGLLMFALLLQQRGWEIFYLGQSTTMDGLATCLEITRPDAVVMSATLPAVVPALIEAGRLVEQVEIKPRPIFAYSGGAFNAPNIDRNSVPGIFLMADLERATNQLCRLVEQPQQLNRRERNAA
jgi:DNA-binding transcriptional MerR regulator